MVQRRRLRCISRRGKRSGSRWWPDLKYGHDRDYVVKTAGEFRQRQVQQLHARLHQNITINAASGRIGVTLDIVPDDDDPHALLAAHDAAGKELARVHVASGFKLNKASASAWIDAGFRRPD